MNTRERKAIAAVYMALAVPFPAGGTQSTTVQGVSGYAADMRKVIPAARRVLSCLSGGENYKGELAEECENLERVQNEVRKLFDRCYNRE